MSIFPKMSFSFKCFVYFFSVEEAAEEGSEGLNQAGAFRLIDTCEVLKCHYCCPLSLSPPVVTLSLSGLSLFSLCLAQSGPVQSRETLTRQSAIMSGDF